MNIVNISVCWSREPHQNRAVVAFYGWARARAHTQRPHPAGPAAQPMATACKKIGPFDGTILTFYEAIDIRCSEGAYKYRV
jgi:hypothetical protein